MKGSQLYVAGLFFDAETIKKNTPVTWTGVFGCAGKQEGGGRCQRGFMSMFED
jgi:hypothetical protein